jgi:hypothetical protein
MRLKADGIRGDALRFAPIVRSIEAIPGVTGVVANPLTGSLLVHHGRETASLLGDVAAAGVTVPALPDAALRLGAPGAETALDALRGAARGIGPQAKIVLFLGLVVLAIQQAAEGHVMAPAVTLLWYAFGVLNAQGAASPAA